MGIRGTAGGAACTDDAARSSGTTQPTCGFVGEEGSYQLFSGGRWENNRYVGGTAIGTITVSTAANVTAGIGNQPPVVNFVPTANVDAGLAALVRDMVQSYPQMFTPPAPTAPSTEPPNPQGGGNNGSSTPQNILLQNDTSPSIVPTVTPTNITQTTIALPNSSNAAAQPIIVVEFTPSLPGNLAPMVTQPFPNQAIDEGKLWHFPIPANTFSDPDSSKLTLTATLAGGSALPIWLSFDASTGTFEGTPPPDADGVVPLTVLVTDGTSTIAYSFTLTVNPVNDAPVLTLPVESVTTSEGTGIVLAGASLVDPDDGEVITVAASVAHGSLALIGDLPPGLSVIDGDGSDGTLEFSGLTAEINALLTNGINYTPHANYNGPDTLTVSVVDAAGATDSEQVTITVVAAANDAPVANNDTLAALEETPVTYTAARCWATTPTPTATRWRLPR